MDRIVVRPPTETICLGTGDWYGQLYGFAVRALPRKRNKYFALQTYNDVELSIHGGVLVVWQGLR